MLTAIESLISSFKRDSSSSLEMISNHTVNAAQVRQEELRHVSKAAETYYADCFQDRVQFRSLVTESNNMIQGDLERNISVAGDTVRKMETSVARGCEDVSRLFVLAEQQSKESMEQAIEKCDNGIHLHVSNS